MAPIMGATIILVSNLVAYSGLVTGASPMSNLDGFWSQKSLSVPALESDSFNVASVYNLLMGMRPQIVNVIS